MHQARSLERSDTFQYIHPHHTCVHIGPFHTDINADSHMLYNDIIDVNDFTQVQL
jgi:hypothetical protein